MAEATQTLVFKITVDGKEVPVTLDVIKGEFLEAGQVAEQAAEKIKDIPEKGIAGLANTPHLKQFAQDLLQIEATSEIASESITEFIQYNQLSEVQLQQVINALREEQAAMGMATAEYKAHQSAISSLIAVTGSMRAQQGGMNASMQAGIPGVNQMRMAMTQFGYVLNDAQVFMINARMGLMGISNNLPMIIQLMQQAKTAAGDKASMMKLLTTSIAGGGGLIIGINALMLLLNLLPGLFSDTTEEMEGTSKETEELSRRVRTLAASFEDLAKEQDNFIKGILAGQIKQTETAMASIEARIKEGGITKFGPSGEVSFIPFTPEQLAQFDKDLTDLQNKLDGYNNQLNQGSDLVNVNIELMQGLVEATRSGTAGVDEFARQNKLSNDQLNNLKNQLKDYYDGVSAVGGGLAKELNPGLRGMAARLKLTRSETEAAINVLDDYGKANDNFAENKQRAVDKFIREEFRQNEAAHLFGLTYEELLNELKNAESDYAEVVAQIKNAQTEKELDAVLKLAELTEIRIGIIRDYVDDLQSAMGDIDDELKKFGADLDKQIVEDETKRQKFEEEKRKFFEDLPVKIESDPSRRAELELNAEEELTLERARLYGATEEQITNIKSFYENERLRIAEEAHFNELNLLQDKINQIQSSYSQIFSIISSGVRQEIDEWKTKEEQKLEEERKSALQHAQTQQQRERINEQFDKRREALQNEADKKAQQRLEMWFNLQKALAISEISINLAKAISVEWGKLGTFAAFTQGIVVAALTAQLAAVASQKFPKGFNEGGRLPKGKMGFFEGEKDEIVAPEEDFKTIFKTYSADLVKNALVDYKNFVTVNSGASAMQELTGLKETINDLKTVLKDGINAQAFLDDETAYEIYLKGRSMYRKGKI